jgi:probable lipoprotein NlpC
MKKSAFPLCICLLVIFGSPLLFAVPPLNINAVRRGREESADQEAREARLALIGEADKYQGAPYRYGGIDGKGFDCSGLIYRSFQDAFSVSVPRNTTALYNWAEKIETGALQPGDLVFFATLQSDKRRVSHAGIYSGEGKFIHAASDGPVTGVIYSRLDEDYWRQSFTAAGRALPVAAAGAWEPQLASASQGQPSLPAAVPAASTLPASVPVSSRPETGGGTSQAAGGFGTVRPEAGSAGDSPREGGSWREKLIFDAGFAPTWNGLLSGGNIIRGGASQAGLAWKGKLLGQSLMPGLEFRPEWDNTLGVFRMPVTLSLGFDERFRIFAGPAFSIGDAELHTKEGFRQYTGGNAFIGAVGLTVAPFSINAGRGALSIYGEMAWQSYFPQGGEERNLNADFSAAFRLSTGLRYLWGL